MSVKLAIRVSCATIAPLLPSADELQWINFNSERMGIRLDIPTDFVAQEYDGDIFFRYQDRVALRISLTTLEDARRRGLWPLSTPIAEVMVAGKTAQKYIYDHYDGPVFEHFVAFVFEHRGQSLAVAFHSEQNELNSTQQRIVESLRLE